LVFPNIVRGSVWTVCLLGSLGLAGSLFDLPIDDSITASGIDALRLQHPPYNLTGRKIAIGQIEVGRPGKFGVDKAASEQRSIKVMRVFYRDQSARLNRNVDAHAFAVAGVMVSGAKALPGIAPQARLYASAAGAARGNGQPEACLAAQHLAAQNGGDLRAVNISFGESLQDDPRAEAVLDGHALLTQCIDWSARVQNVLYVVAGNQDKGGIPIPTDNFNGMTIAASMRVKGLFAKVDFSNISDPAAPFVSRIVGKETNVGSRRSISLIAPGNQISLLKLDNSIFRQSGTSFAAPHVTATVALLQEWGDSTIRQALRDRSLSQKKVPWTVSARRHEVMKAVLINSAEKIKDQGDGLALGMSRTIVNKTNQTWLESEAYRSRQVPLDLQMGAGQLNAYRAFQQFSPGQWSAEAPVPAIGWDYHTVSLGQDHSQAPAYQDYVLEQPLQQGGYVAASLVWDRQVDLVDANRNGEYDAGESFRDRGLRDLNLYLMRAEDTDTAKSIWSSESQVDSVEHIFHLIPETGRYKIRVTLRQHTSAREEQSQPYAIAWWTVPARTE
jgi:hypothetical protein